MHQCPYQLRHRAYDPREHRGASESPLSLITSKAALSQVGGLDLVLGRTLRISKKVSPHPRALRTGPNSDHTVPPTTPQFNQTTRMGL